MKRWKVLRVGRTQFCDSGLHAGMVARSQQFATLAENQAVLRVKPHHGYFAFKRVAGRGEKISLSTRGYRKNVGP